LWGKFRNEIYGKWKLSIIPHDVLRKEFLLIVNSSMTIERFCIGIKNNFISKGKSFEQEEIQWIILLSTSTTTNTIISITIISMKIEYKHKSAIATFKYNYFITFDASSEKLWTKIYLNLDNSILTVLFADNHLYSSSRLFIALSHALRYLYLNVSSSGK
jgi:hypothetical protein